MKDKERKRRAVITSHFGREREGKRDGGKYKGGRTVHTVCTCTQLKVRAHSFRLVRICLFQVC